MQVASADIRACRELLRKGSKSFYVASLVLPARVRVPATVFYAFCRELDDVIDEGRAVDGLSTLRTRVDRLFLGPTPSTVTDRAMAAVVASHRLPRVVFDALVEGFAWDVAGRRYATLDQLIDYCVRVAGTVGVCMSLLMGRRAPHVLARAADLGIAMQLTNIARDVGEDARNGRLYLPIEWLEAEGVDPDALMDRPTFDKRLGRVVERLLAAADSFYLDADAGIGALPADCRPAIRTARRVYSSIGDHVRQNGGDSVASRAFVPATEKLGIVARALSGSSAERRNPFGPCHRSVRFLIEGVEPTDARSTRERDTTHS